MKKGTFFFILFNFIATFAMSQSKTDVGGRVGGSYYIGDYNEATPFRSPNVAGGIFLRFNFNDYYAVRMGVDGGYFTGSYSASDGFLPNGGGSFSSLIFDGNLAFEINFLPFDALAYKKKKFAPFVSAGFGVSYLSGDLSPSLPLSIGIKYRPARRLTVGFEWSITKTFSDKMDGYTNLTDQNNSTIHNNDWYSIAGLFITFRLLNNSVVCPVYQ